MNPDRTKATRTYHNLDIVLVTHNARFRTEARNIAVSGIAGTDNVKANVSVAAVADPVASECPAGTTPDLIRTELLESRSLIIAAVSGDVVGIVKNLGGGGIAKGHVNQRLVGILSNGGNVAVDGQTSLVLDVRDQDGLRDRWEGRCGVKSSGNQGSVLDEPQRLTLAD